MTLKKELIYIWNNKTMMRFLAVVFMTVIFMSDMGMAFSDNLSTSWGASYGAGTTPPGGWHVVSGTFDTSLGYLTGVSGLIYHDIDAGTKHIEYVELYDNGGDYNGWYISTASDVTVSTGIGTKVADASNLRSINPSNFSYVNSLGGGLTHWYKHVIDIASDSSTIHIQVYDLTTGGNIILDNVTSYTSAGFTPNKLYFYAGGTSKIWGVSTSAVSGGASAINSISWDGIDYLEGGTQIVSWVVTDQKWANFLPLKIRIFQNNVEYKVFSSCVLGFCSDTSSIILYSQTGTYPLRLKGSFQYRADLIETGLFSDTVLATASMRVLATAPSSMVVNSSIPSRSPFTIYQSVGYSFAPGQIRINVEHKKNGVWEQEGAFAVTSSPGDIPITVYDLGEYRFTLIDILQGVKLVVKESTANAVDLPIQVNISSSILTIDKSVYYYRDIMQGFYAIDNNNWTNGNTPYLAVRNTTSGLITAVFKQKIGTEQQNNFMLVVGDGNELASNKFRPGNNSLELHSFNTTNDRLLNFTYFNLLDTDQDGNKLRTDKYRYCLNEQILILASLPLQGNLTIYNYKDLSKVLYSENINGTDVSIIFKTVIAGDYLISLKDYSGKQVRSADFVVSSNCEPVPTSTAQIPGQWLAPQSDLGVNCAYWDGNVALLGHGINDASRFEFSLYAIVITMILALIVSKGNFSGAIVVGFFPYAYFAYLSVSTPCGIFMPTWTVAFVALIIGIKMKWF